MWKVIRIICVATNYILKRMLIFQPPEIDECSMVAVKHYDVRISSSDGKMVMERTEPNHAITFMFNYTDDRSVITFVINITVIDINGQRSYSSVVERSIFNMPNIISSKFVFVTIAS